MEKCIIAAVADDGAIGKANALPWHFPADLKFFRQTTMGCPVIMGRATYLSIGRPLPGRQNIVLSRSCAPIEGVIVARSLEEAYAAAEAACAVQGTACAVQGTACAAAEAACSAQGTVCNAMDNAVQCPSDAVQGADKAVPAPSELRPRCFVIGGASIYKAALNDVDRLFITHVHTNIADADAFFPGIDPTVWEKEGPVVTVTDEKSGTVLDFCVYSRR